MTKLAFVLAVVALAVLGAVAADQMQCLKANAQGEIVLAREAKIADITLPAGRYLLHSETIAGKHYVHFVEETKHFEVHPQAFEQTLSAHIAEVKCATEASGKASFTAVYFIEGPTGMLIKKAEIKGENHVHVF
ncbi:MAG TPA: hypothetical protein VEV41_28280 [Terriglobales bacterium]|nr:hypothetical protein [Terriglobales bacterium]